MGGKSDKQPLAGQMSLQQQQQQQQQPIFVQWLRLLFRLPHIQISDPSGTELFAAKWNFSKPNLIADLVL